MCGRVKRGEKGTNLYDFNNTKPTLLVISSMPIPVNYINTTRSQTESSWTKMFNDQLKKDFQVYL